MAVSYNKLWKLLVDKKMSKSDLRKKAEIAPNTMTKLRRDEEVSLTKVIDVVCKIIDEVSFAGTDSVMHGTIEKMAEQLQNLSYLLPSKVLSCLLPNRVPAVRDARNKLLSFDQLHFIFHFYESIFFIQWSSHLCRL